MKIYAIRHGITPLNEKGLLNGWIDEPLAPDGVREIEELRDTMQIEFCHIYCSSMLRTRQTAEIINQRYQVPITYHDELKERNWGELNGMSFAEMEAKYGPQYSQETDYGLEYDYRRFGGESVEDVKQRVFKILDLIKAAKKAPVLMVTHGGIMRLMEFELNNKLLTVIPNGEILKFEI